MSYKYLNLNKNQPIPPAIFVPLAIRGKSDFPKIRIYVQVKTGSTTDSVKRCSEAIYHFLLQMSQDLVKRATRLYEKGTLFQAASQETRRGGTGPEKPSSNTSGVDMLSPWRSLRKSGPAEVEGLSSFLSSGNSSDSGDNSKTDAGSDSGFPRSVDCGSGLESVGSSPSTCRKTLGLCC